MLIIGCNSKTNNSNKNESYILSINKGYEFAYDNRDNLNLALPVLDSIIQLCKIIENDTLFLKSYSLKSVLYGKSRNYRKALHHSRKLLDYSDSCKNQYYRAKAFYKLGIYNLKLNDYKESFSNYVKSKEVFEEIGDSLEVAKQLLDLTYVQINLGGNLAAEVTAIDGLGYLNNSENRVKFKLYSALATINLKQKDYDKALEYRNKAINGYLNNETRTRRDSLSLLIYLNNKALIYVELKQHLKALDLLNLIQHWNILKDPIYLNEKARVLGNIGKVRTRQGEQDAFSYLKRSYDIRVSINDKLGLNASLSNFSEYYLSKQQFDSAHYWGKKTYENAKDLKSPIAEKEALADLLTIGESQGRISNKGDDDDYFSKYLTITDSLERMSSEIDNIYGEQKYRTEQHKIEALENKSKADRNEFLAILASILGFSIVSLLMVYYYYANKAKRERFKKQTAREVYNTEIRLSKKVHDELANDMYAVMTQLQHQTNEVELEALLDKLEVIYERSRDISRATGDIDTENFNAVLRQMLDGYTNDHVNVIMNGLVQGFWKEIAPYKKVEIFRVLRELMTNMKKHSKATLVVVRFKKEGKTLVVSYVDNGKGVDFNQIKYSNGLQNVENRIAGINGGIIFDSKPGKGFKAKITLT